MIHHLDGIGVGTEAKSLAMPTTLVT